MNSIKQPPRMVVVADRPVLRAALWLFVPLLIVAASYGGYRYGRSHGTIDHAGYDSLKIEHGEVQNRALTLERKLADLELSQMVDTDATEQLRQTVKSLDDERAEIEEEVRFYRQLMAPSEAQRGLRIEKLDLIAKGENDAVEYRLLLTQVVDRHDWVGGEVNMDVIGSSSGTPVVLSLTELSETEAYPLSFKFRYFQDFTGVLDLPVGFEAERVVVTAVSSGRKGKQIQKTFGWTLQRG